MECQMELNDGTDDGEPHGRTMEQLTVMYLV